MKKNVLSIIFIVLGIISLYAQDNRFSFNLEMGSFYGLKDKSDYWDYTRDDLDLGGASLHFTAYYNISDRMSAGLGIGLDKYTNFDFNTCPVYASFRYEPLENAQNLAVFADLGYGLKGGDADFAKGAMSDIGASYTWHFCKKMGLVLKLGYNLKFAKTQEKFDMEEYMKDESSHYFPNSFVQYSYFDHTRQSLFLGAGLEF
ncbi:MAG: hypothetical protein MJZ06_06580 [Bacteroidaceae bacterium]|nr:hypothetical protein [Bacteroidaceae bacterium]